MDWYEIKKKAEDEEEIDENLDKNLEKLRVPEHIEERWDQGSDNLNFKVEAGKEYMVWDDLNATLEIFSKKEFQDKILTILDDWIDTEPELTKQIKDEKMRVHTGKANLLSIFKMIKSDFWGGEARGMEKEIPEGTKYISLHLTETEGNGPKVTFNNEEPPKDLVFDKPGY